MISKGFLKYILAFTLLPSRAVLPAYAQTDVHILDVGQGLSVLIESQGHAMLYDGGDADHSSFTVSYVKQQGIKKLDYAVASHYDADHLNGVVGALNEFPAETIWGPNYTADTWIYRSFLRTIEEEDMEKIQPAPGSEYPLGDAVVQILSPSGTDYLDENDYSIAVRIQDGDTSFLITGDAETQSEEEMLASGLNLKSDVYILGHHGSSSSNSSTFLRAVAPDYAVVSCALGNSHGHPHPSVMSHLQSAGTELLRTDLQGTLVASTDGTTITWNTAPCNDYTPGSSMNLPETPPPKTIWERMKAAIEHLFKLKY